jgi:hypothetical protein
MISLTITTCKRYSLFKKTIESFKHYCLDSDLINEIFHYDDSSSIEDRVLMYSNLRSLFPNTIIHSIPFDSTNFSNGRRHMEIMKIWKSNNEKYKLDYVFHLEDDWLFTEFFNLTDSINLLKDNDDIAMVGFSWEKKEFPSELFTPKEIGDFWEWYYSDKHEINESLFLDSVEMKYLPDGFWVNYINWPYFGFRPAVHDVKKLSKLETFNDNLDSFELEFAIRFSKMYKSFLHNKRICYHIGDEISSYNLNNSLR